jgi:integrase
MEIQGRVAQSNGRLKAAGSGVQIQAIGDRLYLRATFPPRPGSSRSKAYQQRLALGFHANAYGISQAEKEARKVGALLDCGEFDWEPYLKAEKLPQYDSVAYWLTKFEAEYRETVCATTWKTEYQRVFNRLDGSAKLTPELLQNAVLQVEPNTRQRKRFCVSLGKLAEFAGVDVTFKSLKGKYSIGQINSRDLPADELIIEWFHCFKNLDWRWVYGMIATFGLRNHEVFYLDTSDLVAGGYKVVVKEGKTGRRAVWSYHPEWVELFGLRSPQLPKVTGKDHADYGERVSQYFGRNAGLPFDAYDLRHRWAIRTMECGLDISLSAQQMGHSVKVHTETYHRWITEDVHQRAFDQLREKR